MKSKRESLPEFASDWVTDSIAQKWQDGSTVLISKRRKNKLLRGLELVIWFKTDLAGQEDYEHGSVETYYRLLK